jgi:anaerobic ribonucleoside-triphosphate reductase activating protein
MKTKYLQLYARLPHTRVLGPGLRYALWVQGCPFRCPQCMTPDALPFDGGERLPIAVLMQDILATPDLEGITISGGEPFAQADGLAQLLEKIQSHRSLGVIVYTGYLYEELQKLAQKNPRIAALLAHIDLLIDSPYVPELNDGISLRGSSNQRLHCLTPRYKSQLTSDYAQKNRQVEIHLFPQFALLAGIPGVETLTRWQQLFPR